MPQFRRLSHFILLPELELVKCKYSDDGTNWYWVKKVSEFEVCPRCAVVSKTVYDRRIIHVKDAPIRGVAIQLKILKRRFFCKTCRKPFTEPVQGIRKQKKTTERFRRSLLWASENFADLKKVRKQYRCSNWLIYKSLFENLELNIKRHINYPWPKTIGIDEHFFSRSKGYKEFATVVVDFRNKRVLELVRGREIATLKNELAHIPGRENVKNVACDLSDPYKTFAKEFFPNAAIIADKFHVLRLLTPHLNRRRKEITGDVRKNPIRKLLLRNRQRLEYFKRNALDQWLKLHPELYELYWWKERLYSLYRTRGHQKAARVLTKMTDQMAFSKLPEIKTLRKTLMKWRTEILNYFVNRITNARTEGFNNIAKLVQRRAFGIKNFKFYRLRYLNACA